MTDSEKLMTVAAWIDKMFPNDPGPEVQTDLRRIAIKLLDLEAELARVKEAAELLGSEVHDWRDGRLRRSKMITPTGGGNIVYQPHGSIDTWYAVNANPTAAALVEQARKEKA